jgi:type IV/VI secretion system ImpK/VasF family protein
MTLTELCEPFFLDVAELMRSAEEGLVRNASSVRRQLMDRLNELRHTAADQNMASLRDDYERIRPDLAYFADDVINNSTLPFAAEWMDNRLLATEPDINVRDGRERFFHDLDATMQEAPSMASQRLAVFQNCLGLGFAGIHRENTDMLQQYAGNILRRLDAHVASQRLDERICPRAYEKDAKTLYVPVRERIVLIGVICVVLFLAVLVTYVGFYVWGQAQIEDILKPILRAR